MRESARANLRESVKFRRLKTAQAYGIRAKRKRGYLYLSLSLSRSVRYGGRRDIYISGRGFAYE